jgi:group I intron endonuclease
MVIYKTTNLIDGMIYVGQDTKNRPSYYGSGLLIKRAIKKFGKENFKKEILEYCNSKEELNEREVFWIKELNSKEKGYNICSGGQGQNSNEIKEKFSKNRTGINNTMYGKNHTDDVKKFISDINKGRKWSEDRKESARDYMLNRKFSEEKKQEISKKISNNLKGKTKTEEHKQKLREVNLGKVSPRKGVKMSEGIKNKKRI